MPRTGRYFQTYLTRTDDRGLNKMMHYMPIYDREMAAWASKPVIMCDWIFRAD